MKPLPVFMGYDPHEHEAYEVACASIVRRASAPILITPLYLPHLTHLLNRPIQQSRNGQMWCPISEAPMSTEFAISRFCVPLIQEEGWALFTDSDVLCLGDIAELFAVANDDYAVMVVKHEHEPAETVKMGGQIQTAYRRKNWSSVMLWNCSHVAHRRLTRNKLNTWAGRDLHAFRWLMDEEIGSLPTEWNYLVGISEGPYRLLHYTLGGPWLPNWSGCPMDHQWFAEKELMTKKTQAVKLQADVG